MKRLTILAGVLVCIAFLLIADASPHAVTPQAQQKPTQTQASARPSFEVASIKPSPPGDSRAFMSGSKELFLATGMPLKRLIADAYSVRETEVLGGPAWSGTDRWDIEAKAEAGSIPLTKLPVDLTVPDAKALMLQSLLEGRFKLKIHTETRVLPVYELVVAKGGPKISLNEDQSPILPSDPNGQRQSFSPLSSRQRPRGSYSVGNGLFKGTAIPLSMFIAYLAQRLDRRVIDKTSLQGLYDIEMKFVSPSFSIASPEAETTPDSGPSFFTAIQKQLGLQLASAKGPVKVIVIDTAQKPSPN